MTSERKPNTGGRKYTLDQVAHPNSKIRRDRMRDLEICINASFIVDPNKTTVRRMATVEHGPPVKSGKCQRCCDVHARSRKPYVSKFQDEQDSTDNTNRGSTDGQDKTTQASRHHLRRATQ